MRKIFEQLGWGEIAIICLFIILIGYSFYEKSQRLNNAVFTKGISLGVKQGARGHYRLYYSFFSNDTQINGSVPDSFCKKCEKCCEAGDTVIVRYERENPENNDLVIKLPEGKNFINE